MTKSLLKLVVCFYVTLSFTVEAKQAILTLAVSGEIVPTPIWVNEHENEIKMLAYDFSSFVKTQSNVLVESKVEQIKLKYARPNSYPVSIYLQRPQNCSIGAKSVQDQHVLFRQGATYFMTDGTLYFENMFYTTSVAFSSNGNYGLATGDVRCSKNGLLQYTY